MFKRRRTFASNSRRFQTRRSSALSHQVEGLERRELLTTYNVGSDQTYTTIGSVPWTTLQPGDTVAIHWQATPYHEKIMMSQSGTASNPINIVGVPGPNGQQPIIDGANATTSSQFHYAYDPMEENSLLLLYKSADQPSNYKVSNVNIEGLEFRNAYQDNTFTDSNGKLQHYAEFAAAIYMEGADNITIKNNTLDSSGLGLFILSNGDEAHTSRNIMVEGNNIYGNGVPGSYLEHDVYTEAVGITYQYNTFGPLRDGSAGSILKDRSAGTVIRYNYFPAGAHILDLVDAEDSDIVASDPSYKTTYVYGNVLNNSDGNPSARLVHFGGDSGITSLYRPVLDFYDNTVINVSNQSSTWRAVLFQLETNAQTVNATNNIFYNAAKTSGTTPTNFELMNTDGVANFGVNWVSPNWLPSLDNQNFIGSINGTSNFVSPSNNNPGFVNLSGKDFHLASGSSAIGAGVALPSGWQAVTQQFESQGTAQTRTSTADLGAFQAGSTSGGGGTTTPTVVPTVTSTTPASSATGVSTSSSLTAKFNEAVVSSSAVFTLVNQATGAAVATTLSYDSSTNTFKLVPQSALSASTTYKASISGVKDSAGNTMSSAVTWSFTTASATTTPPPPTSTSTSLFPSTAVPAVASDGERTSVEVGVKFTSDVAGFITGLRFYKGPSDTGTHVGNLWSSTGQLLASATFTSESATGWQQVNFATPVAISANTTYVASYLAPNGGYAANNGFFTTALSNGSLHAPVNAGVYHYGSTSGFPTSTYQSSNYWVDVMFSLNAGNSSQTTAPTVKSKTPASSATNVATSSSVTATFNEAVVSSSAVFTLTNQATGAAVAAKVSYDSSTNTFTLVPQSALSASTTYKVSISGVKDAAGNAMSSAVTWSFTTAAATTTPSDPPSSSTSSSLFPSTAVPAVASDGDRNSVEVGVKFTSDVAGFITGLRFYKGPSDTGTHVGHLWSSTGQLLASATFTSESATGWQQVNFATPVAISANTTYVASYLAPNGGYAANNGFFTTALSNGSLHAPVNAGVYHYGSTSGFPTSTYQSSNYWVDVVFSTSAPGTSAQSMAKASSTAAGTSVQASALNAAATTQLDSGTATSNVVALPSTKTSWSSALPAGTAVVLGQASRPSAVGSSSASNIVADRLPSSTSSFQKKWTL